MTQQATPKLVFHTALNSSAAPVDLALHDLGVPCERIEYDIHNADKHKQPEFLALNPNGKVPTLVIDGTPMFEGLAIVLWLGDRFGVDKGLWPEGNSPERLRALSWTTWAYASYTPVIKRLNYAESPYLPAEFHSATNAKDAHKELQALLALLDAELSKAPYILGQSYTLADTVLAAMVAYSEFCNVPLDSHAHVKAWLKTIQARESFKKYMG